MSNEKVATLNIKIKELFSRWLDITRAFHKLTNQQQQVLALFLYYHYQFKKDTTNQKILWKMVFDYDTKLKIREDDVFKDKEMSNNVLHNIITGLRKKGIIVDGQISPMFIPDLTQDSKSFKVIFNFNIVDNG